MLMDGIEMVEGAVTVEVESILLGHKAVGESWVCVSNVSVCHKE